ncbi:unnamed protein product (macronuclear) [Paramecium tetraurelia]|uniref:Uncharacterized protein n=1 Tax=Paramecium tetraurelia TaxID=5888 RepID=A0EH84_PARTE|nr:uncharacterized protein GSPATT00026999001 [Paramecium tetraurelia]CAK94675.1 unnamed protein product [Paramecium tetraurelia]|eukprot:XP_001462048.1 hypothetical protein (macronuclear) [Paramecium tetraurelia strain d4-2]
MYPQQVQPVMLGPSGIQRSPFQPYSSPVKVPSGPSIYTQQGFQNQYIQNQQVKTLQTHHMHHTHEYKIPQYQYQQSSPQQVQPQQLATPPPQQPEINELYHVEREMQVLSVEDVEEPWKKKCVELEVKIYDLQTELARYKNQGQELKVTSNEEFQVRELEAKIRMMKDIEDGLRKEIQNQQSEIDSWRQRYQKLQLEYQQLLQGGDEIRKDKYQNQKELQINKPWKCKIRIDSSSIYIMLYIRNKEQEIGQYKQMIRELESEMREFQSTTEKLKYYSNEANVWKDKFMKANQDYHTAQEQCMMAQAELDSLKKQKTITTTEKTTSIQQNNVRRQQQY